MPFLSISLSIGDRKWPLRQREVLNIKDVKLE